MFVVSQTSGRTKANDECLVSIVGHKYAFRLVVIWAFRHLGVQKKVIWAHFFWSFGRIARSFGRTLWTFGRVCPKDYYSVIFGHLGVLFVIEY